MMTYKTQLLLLCPPVSYFLLESTVWFLVSSVLFYQEDQSKVDPALHWVEEGATPQSIPWILTCKLQHFQGYSLNKKIELFQKNLSPLTPPPPPLEISH